MKKIRGYLKAKGQFNKCKYKMLKIVKIEAKHIPQSLARKPK